MPQANLHFHISDDDPHDISVIKRSIKNVGLNCTVTESHNGKSLLEFLGTIQDDSQLPDMLLVDMYMPLMNGLDALIEIKRQERYRNIPAIMLTGQLDHDLEQKIKKANLATLYHKNKFLEASYNIMKAFKKEQ